MLDSVQSDTGANRLKESTYAEQYRRQHLGEDWKPRGVERWQYVRALEREMSKLGGPEDQLGGNPERYKPVSPCMGELDCHCGE